MLIRHNRQTAIGWLIRLAVEGKEIQLFGDGEQRRDFNYVDDVVEAILLAATTPSAEGQIFNLGGDPLSLRETVEVLVDVAASSGGYRLVPFPPERKAIDIGDVYTDYTKITTALGCSTASTGECPGKIPISPSVVLAITFVDVPDQTTRSADTTSTCIGSGTLHSLLRR